MANWNGEVASREEIREQKRRAALRVASRLFNEKGYHATSLDEIAEQIGVTKTALYYYFRNKEELLYDCLQVSFSCGENARQAADALEGTAFEKFCHYYRLYVEFVITQSGTYTTTANIRALPNSMQDNLLARDDALKTYTKGLLEAAVQEGRLREVDPETSARFFMGTINWLAAWHMEDGDRNPRETSAQFLDRVLHGLAAS